MQLTLRPVRKGAEERAKQIRLAIVPPIIEGVGDALARTDRPRGHYSGVSMSDLPSRLLTVSAMSSQFALASAARRAP